MEATVTMPISQLDELRKTIASTQEELKTLKSNQHKIELTIKEECSAVHYRDEPAYDAIRWERMVRTPYLKKELHTIQHSFENMEEFVEPLTDVARSKVRAELDQAEQVASSAVCDLANAKGEFARQKAQMMEAHDKELYEIEKAKVELKKLHEEKVAQLESKIKELQGEAIALAKDEQIAQLNTNFTLLLNSVKAYNDNSWFKKITIPEFKDTKKK